jgi:hypothetical protein
MRRGWRGQPAVTLAARETSGITGSRDRDPSGTGVSGAGGDGLAIARADADEHPRPPAASVIAEAERLDTDMIVLATRPGGRPWPTAAWRGDPARASTPSCSSAREVVSATRGGRRAGAVPLDHRALYRWRGTPRC